MPGQVTRRRAAASTSTEGASDADLIKAARANALEAARSKKGTWAAPVAQEWSEFPNHTAEEIRAFMKNPEAELVSPSVLHKDYTVDRPDLPNMDCYDYDTVPPPLPEGTKLTDIIRSMPSEVFEFNMAKAWWRVFVTLASSTVGMIAIHYSPWYLLPAVYVYMSAAVTGYFVIGHDCGHRSFSKNNTLNDIVGMIAFLPLMYPYESWRIQHDHHHRNTNKLHVDNAWQPFQASDYATQTPLNRFIYRWIKGPMWWFASVGHWQQKHFSMDQFTPAQRPRVMFNLAVLYTTAAVFFPWMVMTFGFSGLVKYWLMPWLGYHFWMSTFTMVHHTLPHIPFVPEHEWDDAQARLGYTVHCEYPYWIEYLTHYINVHVPHHVSTKIPSYNLRKAHNSLKENWGEHMHCTTFSWQLLKDVIYQCHLHHPELIYTPFTEF